jgi:hypothetical protein
MCIMRVDCKLGDLRYVLDSVERLHEVTKSPNKARGLTPPTCFSAPSPSSRRDTLPSASSHAVQICALFVDTTGTDIKTILFRVPEIELVRL